MQNKERLMLAAKAIGLTYAGYTTRHKDDAAGEPRGWWGLVLPDGGLWNPSMDDGDSFRLSAELEMNVFHVNGSCYAMLAEGEYETSVPYADTRSKSDAARKAILEVAIEVGRHIVEQERLDEA